MIGNKMVPKLEPWGTPELKGYEKIFVLIDFIQKHIQYKNRASYLLY